MGKQTLLPYAYSSTPSLIIYLSIGLILLASRLASSQHSTNQDFLHCFSRQTRTHLNKLSSIVAQNSNSSYTSLLNAYIRNARFKSSSTPKPTIIVTPKIHRHVRATVICAKELNIQLKIRSGGHDYDGISYVSQQPFILMDMSNYRKIEVDIDHETAIVEPGATLGELYYRIWEKSKLHGFPGGVSPTIGVGGHITGGGYGVMLRSYGLSSDHVQNAKIMDANGRVLDRKGMGEDLFWAICGGGGASFGVILSYTLRIVPVPGINTVFRIEKTLEENATDIVYRWQQVAPGISNNLFIRVLLQPITTNNGEKTIRASFLGQFLGASTRFMIVMNEEFPELGLKEEDLMEMSWIDSVLWWANFEKGTNPQVLLNRKQNEANTYMKRKSDYVQYPISKNSLRLCWTVMMNIGTTELVFNPYGGRMNMIDVPDTPFPHRQGVLFKIQYSQNWNDAGAQAEKKNLFDIRRLYKYMSPVVSRNPRRAFFNYRDTDIGVAKNWTYDEGKVYGEMYFGTNFDRLVKIKTAVDPENFFRNEQSIPLLF